MITLAQSKIGMSNKVDQAIIDEFRRGSMLLDIMLFDNTVSPGTGGSNLVYGYIKLKTPSTASFRSINEEYTNNEALRESATAELKIFGGNFKLDRVIINTSGAVDELGFQASQKVKAAINLFHNTVINGDSAVDAEQFDGLDVFLTGSSTEFNTAADIDLSTSALIDSNHKAFIDAFNKFLRALDGKPDALLMNSDMIATMESIAQRMGYFTASEDSFGQEVTMFKRIPMIDLKDFYDGAASVPVIGIDDVAGTTDIYAVITSENDGFIGCTPLGDKVISTTMPDLSQPGVIKEGDVEMVAAVALKNSKKAGVFRRIKIQ